MSMELRGLDGQALPKNIVAVYLSREAAERMQSAADEIPYTLNAAATIFKLIFRLTGSGFTLDEGELCALSTIAGQAMDRAVDKEGRDIELLSSCLRVAISTADKRES